jgi:hypothetical protein
MGKDLAKQKAWEKKKISSSSQKPIHYKVVAI